jgi:dihydrofolate reductase
VDRFEDFPLNLRPEHRAPDRGQLLRLLLREALEEALLDAGNVRGRSLRHDLEAAVGEPRVDLPRVGFTPLPLHEPAALESVDQSGQPAAAEDDCVRELGHPEPPVGDEAELNEHVVRGEREAVLLLQLGVERPHDLGVAPEEAGPRGELLVRQLSELSGRCIGAVIRVAHATQDYPRGGSSPSIWQPHGVSLTQYYTATTLDGFIADPDNSLDWLFIRAREPEGPLNYDEFIADIGALAMGSTTYEWILDHEFADKEPADWKWPYDIPCWVFTHRQLPVVPNARIEFTSAEIATVHKELVEAAGGRNVWIVGGGDLAGQFADVGLLDEVIVSIAPVTLGGGAPLLPRRIELRLDELGRNGDFVSAKFSVVR